MSNVIQGSFGPKGDSLKKGYGAPPTPPEIKGVENVLPGTPQVPGAHDIPENIKKAIGIIQEAFDGEDMSFVIVGVKSTGGGADFFTSVYGDPQVLAQAQEDLPGVINRLFAREGIQ